MNRMAMVGAAAVLLLVGGTNAAPVAPPQAAPVDPSMIENFESGSSDVFSSGSAGTTFAVVTNNDAVPAIDGSFSGNATGDQAGTGGTIGDVADLVLAFTFLVDPGTYNVSIDIQAIADVQPTQSPEATLEANGVVANHSFQPADFTEVAPGEFATGVVTLTAHNVDASDGAISGTLTLDGAFRWLLDNLTVISVAANPQQILNNMQSILSQALADGSVEAGFSQQLLSMLSAARNNLQRGNNRGAVQILRGFERQVLTQSAIRPDKISWEVVLSLLSNLRNYFRLEGIHLQDADGCHVPFKEPAKRSLTVIIDGALDSGELEHVAPHIFATTLTTVFKSRSGGLELLAGAQGAGMGDTGQEQNMSGLGWEIIDGANPEDCCHPNRVHSNLTLSAAFHIDRVPGGGGFLISAEAELFAEVFFITDGCGTEFSDFENKKIILEVQRTAACGVLIIKRVMEQGVEQPPTTIEDPTPRHRAAVGGHSTLLVRDLAKTFRFLCEALLTVDGRASAATNGTFARSWIRIGTVPGEVSDIYGVDDGNSHNDWLRPDR